MNADHLQRVRVKIVGVGDGGCKVIDHLADDGVTHFDLIAMNTSSAAIEESKAKFRLLFGETVLHGNGAGGNLALGKKAAEASREQIDQFFEPTRLVYLIAGLGGGTGSGALPVIARIAQQHRVRTVAIVSLPFSFEGTMRQQTAASSLLYLADCVDELIKIRLDDLLQVVGNNPPLQAIFALANGALTWEVIHKLLPNIRS